MGDLFGLDIAQLVADSIASRRAICKQERFSSLPPARKIRPTRQRRCPPRSRGTLFKGLSNSGR